MNIEIGKIVKQREGFSAFIPNPFPPEGLFDLPQDILIKAAISSPWAPVAKIIILLGR